MSQDPKLTPEVLLQAAMAALGDAKDRMLVIRLAVNTLSYLPQDQVLLSHLSLSKVVDELVLKTMEQLSDLIKTVNATKGEPAEQLH